MWLHINLMEYVTTYPKAINNSRLSAYLIGG